MSSFVRRVQCLSKQHRAHSREGLARRRRCRSHNRTFLVQHQFSFARSYNIRILLALSLLPLPTVGPTMRQRNTYTTGIIQQTPLLGATSWTLRVTSWTYHAYHSPKKNYQVQQYIARVVRARTAPPEGTATAQPHQK